MSFNLTKAVKLTRVSNAVAAGTGDTTNCTGVDMKGFKSVTFIAAFGTITATAVTTVKAQQSSDDGSGDAYSDLEGTSISIADDDDNQIIALEIDNPQKRYVRLVITRATANAVIDGAIALQYNPFAVGEPVTNGATVCSTEYHLSPAEGTA